MKNKIISVLLILMIILSAAPFLQRGEAATDYGLTLNISDKSLKGRIALGSECVYVYSHINSKQGDEYKVSSEELTQSITSSRYVVSYVDENKEAKKVSHVKGGFLKLTSSSETIYLPVNVNSDILWREDFSDFSSNGYYQSYKGEGLIAKQVFVENYNNKGENDISFCINGNDDSNLYPNGEMYEIYLQRYTNVNVSNVMTIDFSFCNRADGVAYFNVKFESLVDVIKVNSRGEVYIGGTYAGVVGSGEWHDVSVVLDIVRNRLLVFLDGVFLSEPYINLTNKKLEHFKFGLGGDRDINGKGIPAHGSVAYDDIEIYEGYPKNLDLQCSGLYSDTFLIDNNSRTIYGAVGKTSDLIIDEILPEIKGKLTLSDNVVTEDTIATLEVADDSYGYKRVQYSFSANTGISPIFVSTKSNGITNDVEVCFEVVTGYELQNTNVLCALAIYSEKELISVSTEEVDISSKKILKMKTSIDREQKERLVLFLWTEDLYPLFTDELTEKTEQKTVFQPENDYENLMLDYIALHYRSGLLTAYGKKTILNNKPYIKNSVLYIAPEEISDYLAIPCSVEGAEVNIGLKSYSADYNDFKNGVAYIPAEEYFEKMLSMLTSEFNYEYNGGVLIAGNTEFCIPDGISEKELNSYLFNLRPSKNDIKQMYNSSPLKGEHPRIYIDSNDLRRIKYEIEINEYKKMWADSIIAIANVDITQPIVSYYIDEGGRLLDVSRKVLQYMHTLGMAYLLTGEQKYAERAYLQLEAASAFPDWNPDHSLDTGEMCAAFAVGYDWMYDAFTPLQRRVIEEGFLKNGIAAYNNMYEGVSGRTDSVYAQSNWNAVVNGGVAAGALSFYDVYPENCSWLLANAVRGYENILWRFSPDGGWYEGPGYWEYTIKYTSKMLSNTKRILGTDFSFPLCEGFDKTVDYALAIQSSNGTFSYGDCMKGKYLVPEIFWISNILTKPEYTSTLLKLLNGTIRDGEDLALGLCWYDVNISKDEVFLPLESYIRKEEIVSMRSGWGKTDSFFAASGGTNGGSHDHLDSGSFVFDTGGVRWVTDFGQGNYNNPRYSYWDAAEDGDRWKIFCLRAEAHSTIVINPTTAPDQKLGSKTKITRVKSGTEESILEFDMTEALSENVFSAKRAFALTDSKQSLIIRDEIVLSDTLKSNEIYWILMTDAEVDVGENGAILRKNGETLYLNFSSDVAASISCAKAESFDETGVIDDEFGGVNLNRILIKLTTNEKLTLTVSLSQTEGIELLNFYDKAISDWDVN